MDQGNKFQMFSRTDGSKVACRISQVLYIGKGEHGSVLHFGSGTQVNVHEPFEDVVALLSRE